MGQGFCEGFGTSLHEVVVLGSSRESISFQAYAVLFLPLRYKKKCKTLEMNGEEEIGRTGEFSSRRVTFTSSWMT